MADAKHTPGPWAQSRLSPLTIVAPSGQVVADVGHPRDFHVLLAATDLLEAAQAVEQEARCLCGTSAAHVGRLLREISALRTAIAKATGSAS